MVTMIPGHRATGLGNAAWLEPDKANFDYLYLREDLAALAGKRFSRKRNFVTRFMKAHPKWSFETLDPSRLDESLAFVEEWCRTNDCGRDRLLSYEVRALSMCLSHQQHLGALGGVLRVDGRIAGMTVGEPLTGDVFVVHYEKALREFEGAYQMLCQQFALAIPPEYTTLDREQDLGIDGLRKAKESYFPIGHEAAFTATPRAPAG